MPVGVSTFGPQAAAVAARTGDGLITMHIRHPEVTVPRDAVASLHPRLEAAALEVVERAMGAPIVTEKPVDFTRPAE